MRQGARGFKHLECLMRLHAWLDVSALGTDDLCADVKSLEEARGHLAEGLAGIKDENLAWQMLR